MMNFSLRVMFFLLVVIVPVFADWADTVIGVVPESLRSLLLLGILTGILPALVIILAIAIIIGVVRVFIKIVDFMIHHEKYRRIPKCEQRDILLKALANDRNDGDE